MLNTRLPLFGLHSYSFKGSYALRISGIQKFFYLHFCVELSIVEAVRVQFDEALLHVRQVVAHDLDFFDGGDGHVHLVAVIINLLQVGQFEDGLGEGKAEHVVLEGQVLDVLESERLDRGVVNTIVQKFDLFRASLLDPIKINGGEILSLFVPFERVKA